MSGYLISWFSLWSLVSAMLITATLAELRMGELPMFSLGGKEEGKEKEQEEKQEEKQIPETLTRIPRLCSS